nr:cytochrome c-type biogenesis CcmF C-terminal domain-containing protein [Salmonella enterica]
MTGRRLTALTRDLYAALGESWTTARGPCACNYKPFVRWIWAGGC